MDKYFRIHNRYYLRDAFTSFSVLPEHNQTGGEFVQVSVGMSYGTVQRPYEYTPTGRWILQGGIGKQLVTLATLDSYDDLREFARREFELELAPEFDPAEGDNEG
jgi:hypothetical protein